MRQNTAIIIFHIIFNTFSCKTDTNNKYTFTIKMFRLQQSAHVYTADIKCKQHSFLRKSAPPEPKKKKKKVPSLAPVASVKGMTSNGYKFYASMRESHKVRSHDTHGLRLTSKANILTRVVGNAFCCCCCCIVIYFILFWFREDSLFQSASLERAQRAHRRLRRLQNCERIQSHRSLLESGDCIPGQHHSSIN